MQGIGSRPPKRAARRPATRAVASLVLVAALVVGLTGSARAFSPAEVYRNAAPSVVLIFGFDDSGAGSSGTGSILTADGLVLTNHHVISPGESGRLYPNLVVYFKPQPISGDNARDLRNPHLVEVVARDPELDLALLRVESPPPDLRPIEIGDSEEVDVGEPVAAIGHPGGGGLWTLTTGTVSSKRREQSRDIFQTDAAINPGNSGGPLLDEYARLVGVNTFVRRVNDEGLPLEGLNYSLRSSLALRWLNQQGGTRLRAVSRAEARTARAPQAREQDAGATRAAPDDAGTPADAESSEPPPPVEPEAREFSGPEGERMFGVPNPDNDLHEALQTARRGYEGLTERTEESIREMDRLLDDYEDF